MYLIYAINTIKIYLKYIMYTLKLTFLKYSTFN
jgi:hypothetical protein